MHSTRCEKEGERTWDKNRSEMGAFRVLLGSLHYMGLYMQLSVSTRQAGHGEIENHISGNGECELRFRLLSYEGGTERGCGEDGKGDAICICRGWIKQRAVLRLEAGADGVSSNANVCVSVTRSASVFFPFSFSFIHKMENKKVLMIQSDGEVCN